MKAKTYKPTVKVNEPAKAAQEARESISASGRWSAIQRVRLPHKPGLPLSSGGGGDSIDK